MQQPLAIDLYCGLGGWAEGLLAEGYRVIGFDIEEHDYGTGGYPGELILRDVLTLHGSEFACAAVIVASPPCQAYSYRAMPWSRAKALPPPDNSLFEACFRIQREASEAAGRLIPLIVENVRGAQKWVGRARWHFGSYFLWGDVPALMPMPMSLSGVKHDGSGWRENASLQSSQRMVAAKVPGISFSGYGAAGYKPKGFNVSAAQRYRQEIKGQGGGWFSDLRDDGTRPHWKESACITRRFNSKSNSRKAASAMIAKIPFPLAQHIARSFKPVRGEVGS